MSSLRRICLIGGSALLLSTVMAAVSFAQLRQQPELLRRLWPFGRVQRPAPQLAEPVKPAKAKQRLIAPFVASKIDINTCSLAELQDLPGVNAAMGAHIMAGRPYRNFEDLERDGVPLNVVSGLRGKISFGR
jgi:DNA uptake protein ComE-like DNA-binding protein